MLKLQVANNDVTNGNLAVAWCVDQQTLKELADWKVQDPQVVIIVSPVDNYSRSKEYRKVVPLKDLMTYLEFKSSGPNRIWAFISHKSKKDAREYYLTRATNHYITDVLTMEGSEWGYLFDMDDRSNTRLPTHAAEVVTVNVPAGVFAKEPAKWEKVWVNHWFRTKPQDQCDFRRRRLLAYTVQPIVMLLDMVVRTLFLLLGTLWLSRGLTFKYHLHPLAYSAPDALDLLCGGSWCIADLPEDHKSLDPELTFSYLVRKLWKVVFAPVLWIGVALLAHFHLMNAFFIILGVLAAAVTFALLFVSGTILDVLMAVEKFFRRNKKEPTFWYLDREEIDAVTCNPDMQNRTSVSALPAKHRTINLRFQDLKSRVCRPFSA